ncbi:MAG TPA: histidine kinase [Pyrinomonadaceae bacterium]|nr:histidine kinase [Pyrinomonadaceae bacterium]
MGFSVGLALYVLLALMVLRHRRTNEGGNVGVLLLATAALGIIWNAGELFLFILRDFAANPNFPWVTAAAYSALGFLPSVVVHSAQLSGRARMLPTAAAYLLSTGAAALHFQAAATGGEVPSRTALITLTIGAVSLIAALLIFNFRDLIEKKAVWASALLIFALSSLHLVGKGEGSVWYIELVAHQSSLPLGLVILYQNYRFAFGDLFLKRAISVILLAGVASALYAWVAVPLLRYHETHDRDDALAAGLILVLWVATGLIYPALHRAAVWLVDRIILRRPDYGELQRAIADDIEQVETEAEVLLTVRERLAETLTAGDAQLSEAETTGNAAIPSNTFLAESAKLIFPTAEPPFHKLSLSGLQGGRRILSDEAAMLGASALIAARRIDAIRVGQERFELQAREQEFAKLAAEAELTALRAQINPHFLFNALTTIGYLIEAAPDKALQTLLQLTKLLRAVLSRPGEFTTLGDELDLIGSYLKIEKARFEERLVLAIDVDDSLRRIKIPSLILQPLVENAVKHGIAENRDGGEVAISAGLRDIQNGRQMLEITVRDPGCRHSVNADHSENGVGLENVRGRLRTHYGPAAALELDVGSGGPTTARMTIPVETIRAGSYSVETRVI